MESLDRTGAMTPIAAFLYVAKGILSPDECRKIINEYKDDPEFQWSTVQGAMGSELRTEHDVRKVREIHITDPRVWMWSERRVEIGKSLQSAVRLAVDSYRNNLESNNLSSFFPTITSDEGFKLLHYAEGYHFKEHFDQIPGGSRAFTCSVNLNSDYTGGEFEFFV